MLMIEFLSFGVLHTSPVHNSCHQCPPFSFHPSLKFHLSTFYPVAEMLLLSLLFFLLLFFFFFFLFFSFLFFSFCSSYPSSFFFFLFFYSLLSSFLSSSSPSFLSSSYHPLINFLLHLLETGF